MTNVMKAKRLQVLLIHLNDYDTATVITGEPNEMWDRLTRHQGEYKKL